MNADWNKAPAWDTAYARYKGYWYWFEKTPKYCPEIGWWGGGRRKLMIAPKSDRHTLQVRPK